MSEPTLKDVLSAIAQMQGSITQMQGDITQMQGSITQMQGDIVRLEKGQSEIRAEMATRSELAKVDAKIDATREGLKADIATTRDTLKADIADHRRETSEHRRETCEGFFDARRRARRSFGKDAPRA